MNNKNSKFGFSAVPPMNASVAGGASNNSKTTASYFASARLKNEKLKNYFDDDDDEVPTVASSSMNLSQDDDYDPLDAFMAGVQEQVQSEEKNIGSSGPLPDIVSGQDDRDYESYLSDTEKSNCGADNQDVNYDSDGFPISEAAKKDGEKSRIEPLPIIDHSTISYRPFRKNFYIESAEMSVMNENDVSLLREDLEVSVQGSNAPKPIKSFQGSCLPPLLMKEISKVGFEKPTSIQAQALSIALSGRDMIGLAKTGSGKTLAYVWPMIVHILDQPQMKIGDGPVGIILSPTRELAAQIYTEAKKFAKVFSMRVCAVFGGGGKWEMVKALKEAPEIVVATPGRFIELIRNKATNLNRCTMVVLDEADRMFEMGFEYQMRSIVNNVRPDRQTLLFSATMKRKVEGFARELLKDPIRIVVGTIGQANPDIKQVVEIVDNEAAKWTWLAERADEYVAEGKVLIFVLSKTGVEEVAASLRRHFTARQLDVGVESLHGDKDQAERTISMRKFSKSSDTAILVATDIASRGLDVKDIRTVINYDVAKNIETYVHRIGRTGRMGLDGVVPGTAYTLMTSADSSFAVDLVQNLNLSSQTVSRALQELAEKDPKWGRIRHITAGGGRGFVPSQHASGFSAAASGAGRGGGLGYAAGGRAVPKAMTSSMLASASSSKVKSSGGVQMTFSKAMGVTLKSYPPAPTPTPVPAPPVAMGGVIPGNTAANPYIEGQGMGRGKHLTQPSWSNTTEACTENVLAYESSTTASASAAATPLFSAPSSSQFDDAASPSHVRNSEPSGGQKRSRFSSLPPPPEPAPVMSGFVRASSGAGGLPPPRAHTSNKTVLDINNTTSVSFESVTSNIPVKKSRWDK